MTAPARMKPVTLKTWQSQPGDKGPRCHCYTIMQLVERKDLIPFRIYTFRCPACGREGPQASSAELAAEMAAAHVDAIHDELSICRGGQLTEVPR